MADLEQLKARSQTPYLHHHSFSELGAKVEAV